MKYFPHDRISRNARSTFLTAEQEYALDALLDRYARSFALCIRLLPADVRWWIAISYLLIRAADDIEDGCEDAQSTGHAVAFLEQFARVIRGECCGERLLSGINTSSFTPDGECVNALTSVMHCLDAIPEPAVTQLIVTHVQRIVEGMIRWRRKSFAIGTPADLDDYIHVAAGIPGQLMVALFTHHSPSLAHAEPALSAGAQHMWHTLQITNIVVGIRDDWLRRGVSFVPRQVMRELDVDTMDALLDSQFDPRQAQILNWFMHRCEEHEPEALSFIACIPRREYRMRLFCLVPILIAHATRALLERADHIPQTKLKISKIRLLLIILQAICFGGSNAWLHWSSSGNHAMLHVNE